MKKCLMLCVFLFSFSGFAQNEIEKIQNVIDIEVWKPFQNAFETLDGASLNAVYADKVLRVTPNGIDTDGSFKAANLKRFEKNKSDGISISLDFWFDKRDTNENTSYEVGFYRIGFTNKKGETDYSYGQFHIVLKNINGSWKIIQDWDTAIINGKVITAEDFEKQTAIKL